MKTQKTFYLFACLLTVAAFIVARWGIWFHFPFPMASEDGFEYLELAMEMAQGQMPSFHFIGAGYPLIIAFTQLFWKGLMSIVVFQQTLTLGAVLLLLHAFRKDPWLLLGATAFGVLHVLSDKVIRWETAIFPDSVIASGLLLFCVLTYMMLRSENKTNAVLLGLLSALLILVRSSSIFLLPITVMLGLVLLYRGQQWKTAVLGLTVVLPLLFMAGYNRAYSLEHKFNFLTYGRMGKNHEYAAGIKRNRVARPKQDSSVLPLNASERQEVIVLLRAIPEDTYLYRYLFSWNPHEYTEALAHCRHYRYARTTSDTTYQVCHTVQTEDVERSANEVCFDLMTSDRAANEKAVDLINRYDMSRSKGWFARRLLAYHFNISFPYGSFYYGQLPYNYATTGSKDYAMIKAHLADPEVADIMAFTFPHGTMTVDPVGFDTRYQAMALSWPFKLYDLVLVRFIQPVMQQSVWLLLSLLATLYVCIGAIRARKMSDLHLMVIIIAMVVVSSSITFNLFGNPLPRYSFTTEFTYSLMFFLTQGLWVKNVLAPKYPTNHAQ